MSDFMWIGVAVISTGLIGVVIALAMAAAAARGDRGIR